MSNTDPEEYIDMRQELEGMTHAELVDEVINRMKIQQQIIVDNWNENKELRKEVVDSNRINVFIEPIFNSITFLFFKYRIKI